MNRFSLETPEEDEGDIEDDYSVDSDSDAVGSENEKSNSKQDNSSLKESTITNTVVTPPQEKKGCTVPTARFQSHSQRHRKYGFCAEKENEDDARSGKKGNTS